MMSTPVVMTAPTISAAPMPTPSSGKRQLTDDEYALNSRLSMAVRSCFSRVEGGNVQGVHEELDALEPQLAGLPDFAQAPIRKQIADTRELAARKANAPQ
jgi:hypothetical protein